MSIATKNLTTRWQNLTLCCIFNEVTSPAAAPPTDLSVAPRETSQSHPGHVEQPDLPIVMRQSDDLLVHRHADPGQTTEVSISVAAHCDHCSLRAAVNWLRLQLSRPLRETHLLTAESVRMVAMGDLMFFRSHTLTVRSSLPDTTLSPTVKTAEVTVLPGTTEG